MKPFDFLKAVRGAPLSPELRIGTVVSAVPLRVLFDGEDLDPEGEDEITRPRFQHYLPRVGDRVALRKMGRAWTVTGMVGLGLSGAQAPPGTLVTKGDRTATQTLTHNTDTSILFTGAGSYKPWGGHDPTGVATSSSDIYPPWAGRWRIEAHVGWASNAVGARAAFIVKNATALPSRSQVAASGASGVNLSAERFMNGTTDFFGVVAFQSSGGDLSLGTVDDNRPEFRLYYCGAQQL